MDHEWNQIAHTIHLSFPATNKQTEYETMLAAMRLAKAMGVVILKIRSNLQLVINQATNLFSITGEIMERYI